MLKHLGRKTTVGNAGVAVWVSAGLTAKAAQHAGWPDRCIEMQLAQQCYLALQAPSLPLEQSADAGESERGWVDTAVLRCLLAWMVGAPAEALAVLYEMPTSCNQAMSSSLPVSDSGRQRA